MFRAKTALTRAALVATASMAFLVPAQGGPISRSGHAGHIAPTATDLRLKVLYDQSKHDLGLGTVSQNFSDMPSFDSAAADDFIVPPHTNWLIKEIDIIGRYVPSNGPAFSENVTIYKDKAGKPGHKIAEFDALAGDDNDGSFVLTLLQHGLTLGSGHYFLSVVVNMPAIPNGTWFWENQTTTEGDLAVWQNPDDGLRTGCTTWTTEQDCTETPIGDHMFILKGRVR